MSRATGKERSREKVLQDRAEIARRYLQGEPQWKIGQALGLSQAQISYDLKAVRAEWLASSLSDFNALKSKELAKLDLLEQTYWEAWARSLEERQTTVTERTEGDSARIKAGVKKEQRDGNPAYLQGVERCIAKRCEILGFNAPIRFKAEDLSDDELAAIALWGVTQRGGKGAPGTPQEAIGGEGTDPSSDPPGPRFDPD